MAENQIDKKRMQEFARRLFAHYTSGMITLMVAVGHQTGLFEAAAKGPGTSDELAERARLNERYVREWLGSMVTGGIMEYEAATRRYSLPAEHAVCLTGTSSRNLASNSQMLVMLAKRLPAVVECFRGGGGVPYSEFRPDFTEYMDASWRLIYDGLLLKGFLPLVEGLTERLSAGIRVADIGCGTGHAINIMAKEFPKSHFVGYDIAGDAIERARAEARAMGLANARFEVADVSHLAADNKFDLVTSFDSIHDQRDPSAVLHGAAAALAPDGVYLMVEPRASSNLEENIQNPFAPWMYGVSVLHCMTVSLAVGGVGLGTAWGEQTARRFLAEAGFSSVEAVPAPGPQNTIFVCRH
jgi:SAM-dependent methyltransferase